MGARLSPEQQPARCIAKYATDVATLAHAVLATMRTRLPGAVELVYDNYNALAIAFGATERTADAIFSIALYPRWMSLFFVRGATLPDPQKPYRPERRGDGGHTGGARAHVAGAGARGLGAGCDPPQPDRHQVDLRQAASAPAGMKTDDRMHFTSVGHGSVVCSLSSIVFTAVPGALPGVEIAATLQSKA